MHVRWEKVKAEIRPCKTVSTVSSLNTYMADAVSFTTNLQLPISMNFIHQSLTFFRLFQLTESLCSCPSSIIKLQILENTGLGSTGVGRSRLIGQASKLLTRPGWKSLRLVNSWSKPVERCKVKFGDGRRSYWSTETNTPQKKLPPRYSSNHGHRTNRTLFVFKQNMLAG